MSDLLASLHRAHVERRQRFFRIEQQKPIEAPPMIVMPVEPVKIIETPPPPKPPLPAPLVITIEAILIHVAHRYDTEVSDILSDRRHREIAFPRQITAYLARKLTPHSLPVIARKMRRDHTTILHAVRKIERKISENADFAKTIQQLRNELSPPSIKPTECD